MPKQSHLPILDGFRGIAIGLVMLHHFTILEANSALEVAWSTLFGMGWIGVDFFFVLSGFLITRILLSEKGSPHFLTNFYFRRALRIIPLYYAVLFFSFVVLPEFPHAKMERFRAVEGHTIWYWTFLSNFFIGSQLKWVHGIADLSWSLSIEEQFYLVWPFIVRSVGRRGLFRICVSMIIIAIATRASLHVMGAHPHFVYLFTPARFDSIAIGSLIHLAWGGALTRDKARVWSPRIFASCGFLLLLILWKGGGASDGVLTQVLGFSLCGIVAGSLLVWALSSGEQSRLHKVVGSAPLRVLGKYSYGLYLVHLPLRAALRDLFLGPSSLKLFPGGAITGQLVFYGLALIVSLCVAWLSFHLFEKQVLRLKRHFESRANEEAFKLAA